MLRLLNGSKQFDWDSYLDRILGFSSEQRAVTLIGCRHISSSFLMLSGNEESFAHTVSVESILVGGCFTSQSDVKLKNVYAGYAGLDQYVIESYYDFEGYFNSAGAIRRRSISVNIPTYNPASVDSVDIGVYVDVAPSKDLRMTHVIRFGFPEHRHYRKCNSNYDLVHTIVPSFLGVMMGHRSFVTYLRSDPAPDISLDIFDHNPDRISLNGGPRPTDQMVIGCSSSLSRWYSLIPAWVDNFSTIEKLCAAYLKIMTDGADEFLEVNNLVHLFFALESYFKEKRNTKRSSLLGALKYTICRIDNYFENIEEYISVADSIDINCLNNARNTLVHSNEGDPDYPLVYQQLIFITRSVLLMEMQYPISRVWEDTQHWSLWQFFNERRQKE